MSFFRSRVFTAFAFGAAVAFIFGTGLDLAFDLSPLVSFMAQLAVAFIATFGFAIWSDHFDLHHRRRLVAPVDIDHDDPMVRHVIAQSWNTGKTVTGWRDEDGTLHISERPADRIPIIRRDADGTVVDGTAELMLAMTDDKLMASMHDWRDLDGNELPLPPGSSYEAIGDLDLPYGLARNLGLVDPDDDEP